MKGDQNDFLQRLQAVIPPWFGDENPVLDGLLSAYAYTQSYIYNMLTYVRLQTRLATATEDNLDLIAKDFLGNKLRRRAGEDDITYRNRIKANLLPFPSTRSGISLAIETLTGRKPIIFESWNISDSGAYNLDAFFNQSTYGASYDQYEATFFITVFRPFASGTDFPAINNDFYLNGDSYLWSPNMIGRQVTDDDIYALIKAIKAAGVTALVEIVD